MSQTLTLAIPSPRQRCPVSSSSCDCVNCCFNNISLTVLTPLSPNKFIKKLNLSHQKLSTFQFNHTLLPHIKQLDLSYNNLRNFDMQTVHSIRKLNLKANKLFDDEKPVAWLNDFKGGELTSLDLSFQTNGVGKKWVVKVEVTNFWHELFLEQDDDDGLTFTKSDETILKIIHKLGIHRREDEVVEFYKKKIQQIHTDIESINIFPYHLLESTVKLPPKSLYQLCQNQVQECISVCSKCKSKYFPHETPFIIYRDSLGLLGVELVSYGFCDWRCCSLWVQDKLRDWMLEKEKIRKRVLRFSS